MFIVTLSDDTSKGNKVVFGIGGLNVLCVCVCVCVCVFSLDPSKHCHGFPSICDNTHTVHFQLQFLIGFGTKSTARG